MNVYAPVFQVQARAVIVRSVAMKFKTSKKRNDGFTLVEMLAVTAIVAILLAIGIVAVVHYARWLHITELDNTAREIYLAAENRAVLLSAGGRLEEQVMAAADGAEQTVTPHKDATSLAAGGGAANAKYRYIYYDGNANRLEDLLPAGTIDPALREGRFYIVYEVNMGSVADVFYAEDGDLLDNNSDFQAFYEKWRGSSRQKRLDEKRMIGYYGGETAGNDKTDALQAPILIVHNEEELWVELTYKVPTGETRTPVVKLYRTGDKQYEIVLSDLNGWEKTSTTGINGTTYTWTRVLDSLETGKQFQDLYKNTIGDKPTSFGWEFTVEAWLEGGTVRSTSAYDTGNNSLFADETHDGPTAYIGNLRHLQNLDEEFSKVRGKTSAVQIADIDCGESMFSPYEFVPIVNDTLKSYCGSYGANGAETVVHFIKGLTVKQESAEPKNGGLFSIVPSDMTLKDVRLINTSVKMDDKPAGALVGVATGATFTNCWVYWEGEELEGLKASITGTELTDDDYQITGTNAGGLVGVLNGGTITDCLAATLVKGTTVAGGLVGQTTDVTVNTSYADCYLKASTAAGLIGTAGAAGTVTLTNVYTAGFIDNTAENVTAAGLCNGSAMANHAYSAMHYEKTGEDVLIVPLAEGVTGDNNSCDYLKYNGSPNGKSFEDMIKSEFVGLMNGGSAPGAFAGKKSAYDPSATENEKSHPYNLLDGVPLTVYPFPGLADLPHYGDWSSEIVSTTLVYYEQYGDGTYRFQGVDALSDNAVVSLDGYAVMLTDLKSDDVTIEFTYLEKNGKEGSISQTYTKGSATGDGDNIQLLEKTQDEKTYYFAPLPKELINSAYASEDFYQPIGIEVGSSAATWFAYNPHFAKTAEPIPEEIKEVDRPNYIANMGMRAYGYVRTPRHLRALSQFETYAHGGKYEKNNGNPTWVSHTYTYIQELDLDYTTYEGYDWKDSWKGDEYTQEPIGKFSAPFNGIYDGGCHTIENVKFKLPEDITRQYAGLFGLSAGNLRNIVYLMNPTETVSVSRSRVTLLLGALAGGNSGTIDNCAVAGADLEGTIYNKAEAYVGGLVGINNGAIRNCAAEVASLKARGEDFSTARAGGLVGKNNRTISTSYAVGYISGKAQDDSTVRVCGFVGYNIGEIRNSYTAARLESSGAGVETYGFCGEKAGSQKNTCFVDRGNFTYREEPYNGTYSVKDDRAAAVSYQSMKFEGTDATKETPKVVSEGGMAWGGRAVNGNPPEKEGEQAPSFPLPTGVKDRSGNAVHYGQWPVELDLGNMGVYYWEKMKVTGANGVREIYGVSVLKVDPNGETVEKISTLSNARSDGGVVTDYGYGWYYEAQEEAENHVKTEFSTEGLSYTKNGGSGGPWKDQESDETVNAEMAGLMPGYEFRSYHSFVPNPDPNVDGNFTGAQAGLYATGVKDKYGKEETPNGTVTLEQGGVTVTFEINPHFADALAVKTLQDKWEKLEGEIAASPGTKDNPYEVRAMGQLSAINWNSTNRDTKTVMKVNAGKDDAKNTQYFTYLSSAGKSGKYYWLQTHDIKGEQDAEGNYKTYTPIAEYYDNTEGDSGTLEGWFGGTFDGDDYVIENVNIKGQQASCAGLFGMVYQGTLRSMILYSSDGNGVIGTDAGKAGSQTQSRWYAMGTLAGMVGASNISNCSAAGYKIDATVYTYNSSDGSNKAWGGNNIGGLIGATDGNLSGCAAEVTINVHDAMENDNMRVGGLVGVCQGTISNCYAGGSISFGDNVTVQRDNRFIYVGGLVGGSYMKPLKVVNKNEYVGIDPGNSVDKGNTSNTLIGCYSYVTLPKQDAAGTKKANGRYNILALYALGGTGEINKDNNEDKKFDYSNTNGSAANHGICTITNCYYLKDTVLKNDPLGSPSVDEKDSFKTDIWEYRGRTEPVSVDKRYEIGESVKLDSGAYSTVKEYYFDEGKDKNVTEGPGTELFTDSGKNFKFAGWLSQNDKGEYVFEKDPNKVFKYVEGYVELPDPMALTYKQLTGEDTITKENGTGNIYGLLPDFRPVTATEDGFAIPGKYSYSTKARPELQGRDYPFPTILTRENGTIHVHYGDWPLNGIERDTGGAPIRLDLLKVKGEENTETLRLSEGVPTGGTWTLETKTLAEGETPIIEAYLGDTEGANTASDNNGSCKLTVKGLKTGQTDVTVVYVQGGVEYGRVTITVNVTATLRVKSKLSPIYVYPGAEHVVVPLVLCDDEWNELTEEKLEDVKIDPDKSVCRIPDELLSSAQLVEEEGNYYLLLEAKAVDDPNGEAQAITVSVPYTYREAEIEPEHSMLSVVMRPLPEAKTVEEEGKSVTRITFDAIPLDEKEEAEEPVTAETTVDEVRVVSVKNPEPTDPDNTATDPDAAEGSAEQPEVKAEGNAVLLKNYAPGAEVTLELTLWLKRSDAEVDDPPITQIVQMTVTIPEPKADEGSSEETDTETPKDEKTNSEAEQAENQEAVQAAEPEQIQDPELPVGERAKLPEGPDPALPVEEKTDPVPEKDAGTGEDGTEPEQ